MALENQAGVHPASEKIGYARIEGGGSTPRHVPGFTPFGAGAGDSADEFTAGLADCARTRWLTVVRERRTTGWRGQLRAEGGRVAGGEEGGAMTEPESREETARQLLDDAITEKQLPQRVYPPRPDHGRRLTRRSPRG